MSCLAFYYITNCQNNAKFDASFRMSLCNNTANNCKIVLFFINNAKVTGYWISYLPNIGYLFYCCGIFSIPLCIPSWLFHIFLFINEASNLPKRYEKFSLKTVGLWCAHCVDWKCVGSINITWFVLNISLTLNVIEAALFLKEFIFQGCVHSIIGHAVSLCVSAHTTHPATSSAAVPPPPPIPVPRSQNGFGSIIAGYLKGKSWRVENYYSSFQTSYTNWSGVGMDGSSIYILEVYKFRLPVRSHQSVILFFVITSKPPTKPELAFISIYQHRIACDGIGFF